MFLGAAVIGSPLWVMSLIAEVVVVVGEAVEEVFFASKYYYLHTL